VTVYEEIPLKNQHRPYFYCLVICISTIYSGYSLTVISASNLRMLQHYYNIEFSNEATLSLLNGILPVGGMLGSILVPTLVPLTTKK
jgi:hypothetical protein